jgi:hypothetical protein
MTNLRTNTQRRAHTTNGHHVKTASSFFLLTSCLLLSSCGSMDITSTFRNRAITVDGDANDWSGLPLYTGKNISVAVCNDSTDMYILLTTSDRSLQRQLAATGVNIWFDTTSGSDRISGIHYPVHSPGGFGRQQDGNRTGMQGGIREQDERPGESRGDAGEPPRMMDVNSNDLEVLGPGKDDKEIVSLMEAKDLQIRMSSSSGMLVFELRVPLVRDPLHPHGIGTFSARPIGVGVETPKFDFPQMSEHSGMGPRSGGQDGEGPDMGGSGGMPPGGMGGGRGGPGGGGHRGGEQRPSTVSVNLWAKVALAVR